MFNQNKILSFKIKRKKSNVSPSDVERKVPSGQMPFIQGRINVDAVMTLHRR